MAVITNFDEKINLMTHHFSERISIDIFSKTIEKTLLHPNYTPGMNAIWYCDDDTKIEMSSDDTIKLSELASQSFDKEGMSYKLALVAKGDLAFGMTRVYEGWSVERNVSIKAFRELDEAYKWITTK